MVLPKKIFILKITMIDTIVCLELFCIIISSYKKH